VTSFDDNTGPWALPDVTLPDGEVRPMWVEDGVIVRTPVDGAQRLPGRFTSPGLVDAHIHLALHEMKPAGMAHMLDRLRAVRSEGVLLVRDMGAPGSLTLHLAADDQLPSVIACGRHLHAPGTFLPDCQDPVPPEQLVDAALAEVRHGATWVKVIADWNGPTLSYPINVLKNMVDAVHAAGARVAAHSQHVVVRDVVMTGVDSIEHGTDIDDATLDLMAEKGIAWTPTTGPFVLEVNELRAELDAEDLDAGKRIELQRHLAGAQRWADQQAAMIPLAAELGVRLLAATDNAGTVAEEVGRFIQYGVDPVVALSAATTDARQFLGFPSLQDGAPADVVTFDEDPRADTSALARPVAVLRNGVRVS
jgi:imidazolonepropionase-like amidohydrolase